MGTEHFAHPSGVQNPDHPSRSELLHWLHYPSGYNNAFFSCIKIWNKVCSIISFYT